MNCLRVFFALFAVVGLFSVSASADRYGMAGCGLGSQVFDEDGKIQILAATTNGTSGNQTFGITFGTSNCTEGASGLASTYLEVNQEALKKDAARGQGESLSGLSKIYGCKNMDQFNHGLQKNYSEIFEETQTSQDRAEKIQSVISAEKMDCKA